MAMCRIMTSILPNCLMARKKIVMTSLMVGLSVWAENQSTMALMRMDTLGVLLVG